MFMLNFLVIATTNAQASSIAKDSSPAEDQVPLSSSDSVSNIPSEISSVASDISTVAFNISSVALSASQPTSSSTFCWKSSYSRGFGRLPHNHTCPESHPTKHLGLCYETCLPAYRGFLTRCTLKCDAIGMVTCGLGCAANGEVCAMVIASQVGDVVGSVVKTVATMTPKVDLKDFQAGKCVGDSPSQKSVQDIQRASPPPLNQPISLPVSKQSVPPITAVEIIEPQNSTAL